MKYDKLEKSKQTEREIQRLLDDAWLGVTINDDLIDNPISLTPRNFEDSSHLFFSYVMSQPDYLGFFCKHILNIELAPFQMVILKELWERKFPMFIATRGGGKSLLLAVYAILRALILPNRKIIVAGSVFRQSKIVFEYIESIYRNAPMLQDMCSLYQQHGARRDPDMWRFHIADSIISAIPIGNGSTIRGMRGNDIICDEFGSLSKEVFETVLVGFGSVSSTPMEKVKARARQKKAKEIGYNMPQDVDSFSLPNQILISGTADFEFGSFYPYYKRYKSIIESRGNEQKFREAFGDDKFDPNLDWKDFSIIKMPVELLPDGFMDEANIARARATIDSGTFASEYGTCFSTDSSGFFRRSLIEGCVVNKNTIDMPSCGIVNFKHMVRGVKGRHYIMGVDAASENDNFAIVLLERHPDHRRIVYCWTMTRRQQKEWYAAGLIKENDYISFAAKKIRELMRNFQVDVIAMDSQGGGYAVLERLGNKNILESGELPIYEQIDPNEYKHTDSEAGLHVVQLIQFADYEWVAKANHGMKLDFESKCLLFPAYDTQTFAEMALQDAIGSTVFNSLEEVVMEVEEMKNELTSIVVSKTPSGRDKWGIPTKKIAGQKIELGSTKKDRYSALLMANGVARDLAMQFNYEPKFSAGGFAYDLGGTSGPLYQGPPTLVNKLSDLYE